MLNRVVPSSVRHSFGWIVSRHLSLTTTLAQSKQQQATDPIQQLFVSKIREYYEKRKWDRWAVESEGRSSFHCLDKRKTVWSMRPLKCARVWKTPWTSWQMHTAPDRKIFSPCPNSISKVFFRPWWCARSTVVVFDCRTSTGLDCWETSQRNDFKGNEISSGRSEEIHRSLRFMVRRLFSENGCWTCRYPEETRSKAIRCPSWLNGSIA